ncbi:tRNA U55 pseudouridine synthase TruB [Hokovirus HKV1]|uniref:tRNA pseudouridine(55) synthase n=1 Tax=Hokovirus HKV1 TaxID=1977638 RepID=A0A1V0SF38_9VIRU|nr:tRNA U55 pseudouridine synthase TruB [Hokovirus HKV1]
MGKYHVYKPVGQRMGELIEHVKSTYTCNKACYSGRLDEMAEGIVLILTDEDCKDCRKHDQHNKIYEFTMLAGISTDTGDILGIHQAYNDDLNILTEKEITNNMLDYNGKHILQKRPVHSSIKYKILKNNQQPEKRVYIENCEYLGSDNVTTVNIIEKLNLLNDINNTFRKQEIINCWEKYLGEVFKTFTFRVKVSSGTYVRQLIMDVSEKSGFPLTALNIKRIGYC